MTKKKGFLKENFWLLIFVILLASIFTSMFYKKAEPLVCSLINCGEENDRYFESLSAFFTMLAFLGVVFTLFLQWKDLRDTKDDIDEQNDTLALQRFEHTFFTVLEMHNKLVDGFFMEAGKYGNANNLSGKSVLQFISDKMVFWADPKPEEDNQFVFGSNYPADNNFRIFLDQYFGSFYNLYEQCSLAPKGKDMLFSDIVRSRLIAAELVLLYLHGHYDGPEGFKFRPIIEKYALLKNIGVRVMGPSRSLYDLKAYDGILY